MTATSAEGATADPAIRVERLRKRYGAVEAVAGVSFQVRRGEVVGLLGPNGAGKSTTIRILTGFLPATDGVAAVAGHDVARESLQARRQLGYLPEHVPLYTEMRVDEYLRFRAQLKGVPRAQRRARVGAVIERCWLAEMRHRLIGFLSKGYRQRVGLADALLAEPPILVLDEPTVGLDPNQVRQVRTLIRELGERHTILLSTHILREVEAVCSRAIILARGRLVHDATLAETGAAAERAARLRVETDRGPGDTAVLLRAVPGVAGATPIDGTRAVRVTLQPGADPRGAIARAVVQGGHALLELSREVDTLEDVFTRVTMSDAPEAVATP